jgi:UDP-glucose 4-epimerase
MRVVVTGGAGFIGSHIADAFVERGDDVLVVDDFSTGRREHVPQQATVHELDIADAQDVRDVLSDFGAEFVCHLAAQSSVTVSVSDPERDFASNVRGTFNVCRAATELGVRIVYSSTGGVMYGNEAPIPTPETFAPAPLSPYGASKLAGETYVSTWARAYGVAHASLRLGNVYGPRQNPFGEAGAVAIFSERLLSGDPPIVYGFGKPTRDYVHVADVKRAFTLLADQEIGGVFNVGWGREVSVLELLDAVQRAAGTSVEPRLEPLRPGEHERGAIDSSAAETAFGWRPEIELEEGIAETFRWYAAAHAH